MDILSALIFIIAVVLGVGALVYARHDAGAPGTVRAPRTPEEAAAALEQARRDATETVQGARVEALTMRESWHDEAHARRAAIDETEAVLGEQDAAVRELQHDLAERREAQRQHREELDAEQAAVMEREHEPVAVIERVAALDLGDAQRLVLERLDAELAAEHPERVARGVEARAGDLTGVTQSMIRDAIQRQTGSHADTAPRVVPVSLEGLDDASKQQLLDALGAVAGETATEVNLDTERDQVSLRGIDPVGREVARQASLEVLERRLQVEQVHPLLIDTRRSLEHRLEELGERAMWEMGIEGRPELAELIGTLHYRFSYGQNALLHCREAGYLCGALAAELGMDQAEARRAGMLHDVGKAVDHDVEGSHAIIGGELLRLFGTPDRLVHAVKAHHFEVEPATDLALLTICADAISASRPGARRDTLTAYLARLEQLQQIATRHSGVERAFPMQAGREVRVTVRPYSVTDRDVPHLCAEIAREIEAEMQYPGVIKVTVIRETMATATAKSTLPLEQQNERQQQQQNPPGTGRKRRRRRAGAGRADGTAGAEDNATTGAEDNATTGPEGSAATDSEGNAATGAEHNATTGSDSNAATGPGDRATTGAGDSTATSAKDAAPAQGGGDAATAVGPSASSPSAS